MEKREVGLGLKWCERVIVDFICGRSMGVVN